MTRIFTLLLLIAITPAQAQTDSDLASRLASAMAASDRPDNDIARDANRKPVETLEFFRLRPDMKLLELIPGGGWYTRLLAPTFAPGQFYVALGTGRVEENLVAAPGFEKMRVLKPANSEITRDPATRLYTIGDFSLGETDFDAALTFRNLHNFGADDRRRINLAVFEALKPGGLYGVVDHTRRHMEPDTAANRRRADPVLIIREMLDAGFEWVDFSTLHYRPVDDLTLEVGEDAVTGRTDRFTLLFRKPGAGD